MHPSRVAYTQADVDALEAAIKSGVLRSRVADRETTFRSLDEMQTILREMKRQVAGTKPGPRHQLADFSGSFGS